MKDSIEADAVRRELAELTAKVEAMLADWTFDNTRAVALATFDFACTVGACTGPVGDDRP